MARGGGSVGEKVRVGSQEETYQYTSAELEAVPTPSVEVIKSALDIVSAQYPQAKQTDPNLIVHPSFVSRIEQSGFVAALYKK
jgi:hypothetical protein